MAAFAMAVYFSGMEDEELAAWTQAMLETASIFLMCRNRK